MTAPAIVRSADLKRMAGFPKSVGVSAGDPPVGNKDIGESHGDHH